MKVDDRRRVDESVRLMAKVGRCWSPTFSPDGQELAFVSDLTGSPQVWRIALSGGFPEAVTAFDEQVNKVLWSPDGNWMAVESAPGGGLNAQIDLVRPDGSDRRRLTEGQSTNNWLNAWTKDSRYVLFSSNMGQADSMDSFRVCIDSGASEKLASNGGTGVIEDVTADGERALVTRIAYRGDNNVYLVDFAAAREHSLTPHDPPASFDNARFSADERHVFLVSNRDQDMACLCRLPSDDGENWRTLRARDDAELVEFALSPNDNRRLSFGISPGGMNWNWSICRMVTKNARLNCLARSSRTCVSLLTAPAWQCASLVRGCLWIFGCWTSGHCRCGN